MVLGAWGNTDHDDCVRLIHRAVDAGINLIDTADVYAFGESEEIVGQALEGRRDDVVLATKFHNGMPGPDGSFEPNRRGNSRRWIRQAVEDSLRRLRTDHIDLYQVHRPDPSTDIAETIDALTDLVRAGKIRAWGTSTFPAAELVETCWAAERRHVAAPHTEQPPYSIMCRGIEAEVLPACRRHGLGVIVWSPLSGGWLTGKYRTATPPPAGSRAETNPDHFDGENDVKYDAVEQLDRIATEAGLTLTQLALGLRGRTPGRDSGADRAAHRTSSSTTCSPLPTSPCRPTCSTRSTKSSLPVPTSTPQTPAGHRPASIRRTVAAPFSKF